MRPFGLASELKTIIPTIEIANGGLDYPGPNAAVCGFVGRRVGGIGDGL